MRKELLGTGGVVAMGTEWTLNTTMILVELDGWIQRGNNLINEIELNKANYDCQLCKIAKD